MDMLVGGRFRLGKKIGSGEFADVYLGTDVSSQEEVRKHHDHSAPYYAGCYPV